MPYDVVGNAAGRSGAAFTSRVANNFNGGGGRHHNREIGFGRGFGRRRGGGLVCEVVQLVYCVFFCVMAAGLYCLFAGSSYLFAATTDSRGQLLSQWSAAVGAWTSTAEPAFAALSPTVGAGAGAGAGAGRPLSLQKDSITPSRFGEDSWSTSKIKTVGAVDAETWTGKATCDTKGAANTPCTITLKDKQGATVGTKTVTPMQQVGPDKVRGVAAGGGRSWSTRQKHY